MKTTNKLLLIGAMAFLLVSCATDKSSWQKAKKEDTVESYQTYLKKYPQGAHKDEAEEAIIKKSVKISVKQSYGEAKNVSLPIEDWIVCKLRWIDFYKFYKDFEGGSFSIDISGTPLSAYYISGIVTYLSPLYTGAFVKGTITFEKGGKTITEFFFGKEEPPKNISITDPEEMSQPDDAPFEEIVERPLRDALYKIVSRMKGLQPFISALKDEDSDARRAAAEALEKIDPKWRESEVAKKAVPEFISALKDSDSDVREATAEALGKIKDPRAVEPLISALKDENWSIREATAEALGEIKDPRAVEPLISALKVKDEDLRSIEFSVFYRAVVEALKKIKDPHAVEPLISALKDENSNVRNAAAYALGEIKDTRAVKPLICALKDEDSDVRQAAAYALGEIKDPRAVEPLISALRDSDSDLRWEAAVALENITGQDFDQDPAKWQAWWEKNKEKFKK